MTLSPLPYRRNRGAGAPDAPRRRAALAVSFALVAFPAVGTLTDTAGTITVTFTGRPASNGPTSCPSTPDVTDLRVRTGTTVNFADELGVSATLWAGDSHKHLGDDEMVPVTFTSPAFIVIKMLPDCALDIGAHGQITVTVSASGTEGPARATPTASPGPRGSGAGHPGGAGHPSSSTGADDNYPFATPAPATSDTADQLHLAAAVPSEPTPHGASGLLTLVAAVCIVGVTVAALRAIVAQRATRTFSQ